MKRYVLLLILLPLLYGCDNEDMELFVDYGYEWKFVVANETGDKEIIVTQDYPYGPFPHIFALAPKRSDVIWAEYLLGSEATGVMPDFFEDGSLRLVVGGFDYVRGDYEVYPFTMTVDGKKISSDIWLRKHWSFSSELYVATYTLTVTDELLASLSALPE